MNHDHSQGGMGKHMLLMIICCAVPLLLVGAVSVFGLSLGPLQPLIPYVAALMCPLMMIGMMWMMARENQGDHSHHQPNQVADKNRQGVPDSTLANANASSGKDSDH